MATVEPFRRLVKLVARAFYDDVTTKGATSENRGIAVVVLDALTKRQWVREEDLAEDLKLHSKILCRTLKFLEKEKLVTRDCRKETAEDAKMDSAAVAATVDGEPGGIKGDEKHKKRTYSYCCLDYAQIYDVVRYKLHHMRKMVEDALESDNTVQEYICPKCNKRYTTLDALWLSSPHDEYFHCESCTGILGAEADKLAAEELGDGGGNARRRRHEKVQDMVQKMKEQLKPLIDQLGLVKDLPVPEFGNLHDWALHRATGQASNVEHGNDLPSVGDREECEVAFWGIDGNPPMRVLPPWMIKNNDKKTTDEEDDVENLQEEYVDTYCAAGFLGQEAQDGNQQQIPTYRQVGMKSKLSDVCGRDDEWSEEPF